MFDYNNSHSWFYVKLIPSKTEWAYDDINQIYINKSPPNHYCAASAAYSMRLPQLFRLVCSFLKQLRTRRTCGETRFINSNTLRASCDESYPSFDGSQAGSFSLHSPPERRIKVAVFNLIKELKRTQRSRREEFPLSMVT